MQSFHRRALVSLIVSAGVDVALQKRSKLRYEPKRTLRVASFAYASSYPQIKYFDAINKVCKNMVQKTCSNQFLFAPINIAAGIAWNLAFQGEMKKIPETIRKNIIPGLTEGACYWIPLNMLIFSCVSPRKQFVAFKLASIPAKFMFVERTTKQ